MNKGEGEPCKAIFSNRITSQLSRSHVSQNNKATTCVLAAGTPLSQALLEQQRSAGCGGVLLLLLQLLLSHPGAVEACSAGRHGRQVD